MRIHDFSSLVVLMLFSALAFGQAESLGIEYEISWNDPIEMGAEYGDAKNYFAFDGAEYDISNSDLPFLYKRIPVKSSMEVSSVQLINTEFVELDAKEQGIAVFQEIGESIEPEVINAISKKEHLSFIKLYPFRKNPTSGKIEKLKSFRLQYSVFSPNPGRNNKSNTYAANSVLANGNWYRIGVTENKVYKLTYHFLKNIGLDVDNINPRNIRIYGNGAGQLPEANDEPRPDDLLENSIMVVGEEDGSFDPGDYVIFFGEGPVEWKYNNLKKVFNHETHYYADTNFYFITADLGTGKRISTRTDGSALNASKTVNTFLDYQVLEQDRVNLIHSGKEWLGDIYDSKTTYTYSFNFPNAVKDSIGWFKFFGVVRSGVNSSFQISLANQSFNVNGLSTDLSNYVAHYGREAVSDFSFQPTTDLLQMNVHYNKPQNTSKAWLNYIQMNVWRQLNFSGNQMKFCHPFATKAGEVYEFQIGNAVPQMMVWDISDKQNIVGQEYVMSGTTAQFKLSMNKMHEFVAFNKLDSNVVSKGKVPNQNLHGYANMDMVIVSHPLFFQQSQQLAEFHESEGLNVVTVTPQQVYNEFSSGMQDPVAIRTFMKMFYDRANNNMELPSYLLLFGDASYDPKNRISGNTNFVVTYESSNYLDPTSSYASDDYFGFLDDKEGRWIGGNDKLDIGVGRLPVRTQQEAQAMVNKIIQYSTPQSLGEWRNEIVFIGDDEDLNMHMRQANQLANTVENNQNAFNVSRILIDSYQEISTPSGARYPEVNKAISKKVEQGSLIINYTGHGGETGLAEERILTLSDIASWRNSGHYPLFVTATCEFSRYDDPLRVSAGEEVLLSKEGGSIGLLTTTRPAFAQQNFEMSKFLYSIIFNRKNSEPLTVGEIYRQVKVNQAGVLNARNFTYLGDPAIQLAIPRHKVVTTSINGKPLSSTDTLKALSKVTVSGYVVDYDTEIKKEDFNGVIYPTVFDKKRKVSTLNNNGLGVFNYEVRDSRLFNGKASVNNGEFSFSFIVPKDISYEIGEGKITYYATDFKTDANGFTSDLLIGGSSDSAMADNKGPELEMYMNSEDFVYGGMTNENPIVIIEFYDELGINTVGNGIGHDITMIIDGNTEKAIVLNEFYEANMDDYRKGRVEYQLKDLAEGKHTLTVKSWDVANNSSESTIEFVVMKEKDIEINHVLNYPNPFTSNTEFWFEHNQPGIPLDVKIQVFTVSGKLVKSIDKVVVSEGFRVDDINWDGKDDFGDKIGRGVYLYKLKVRSRNGSMAEKIEKLVIL